MKFEEVYARLQERTPTILGSEAFSRYSVLIPLLEINNDMHILFEVRSQNLRRQPGEICFPGGKFDEHDTTEKQTAIRETSEELGIDEDTITNVLPLDYMVSPFGMIVYPFIGVLSNPEQIQPSPSEVSEIFTVPLSYLNAATPEVYKVNVNLQPEKNFPFDRIIGGEDYQWQARKMNEYFYSYQNKVIWGLTARILKHLLDVLKKE